MTRCIGNLIGQKYGIIPDPEIMEINLKRYKVKFAVLGNDPFWKIFDVYEVKKIVSKYIGLHNPYGVNKEIDESIKLKVGSSSKIPNTFGYSVVFFDGIT